MLVSLPPFRPPRPWPRAFALGALSLATLLVSASTRAETRKALLIANAEYRVDGMTLANPVRDAEKVRASLLAAGFAKADVALVRDVPARGIENVVGVFADSLEPGDVALFYYSGHGMQSKGVNYLLGTGFDKKREVDVPYGDVYPVRQLIDNLESSRASVRFVIIDACRDMPLSRGWKGGRTKGFAVEPKGEGGTLLAFATSPNSRALDVGFDGGPYAHVLSQLLLRPGKEALHLFRDIQNEVRRLTNGAQVPAYAHNLLADFYFVPPRSAPPTPPPRLNPEARCRAGEAAACRTFALSLPGTDRRGETYPLLRQACELGDQEGCVQQAMMMDYGTLTAPSDLPGALRLLRRACDAGIGHGCNQLARRYREGRGVKKSQAFADRLFEKALRLARPACAAGQPTECYTVGWQHGVGHGVEKDEARSAQLYRQACDGGYMVGCSNLGARYEHGSGVDKDEVRSAQLYRQACDGGYMGGCSNLGLSYEHGRGVDKDEVRSAQLYRQACDGGYMGGCTNLGVSYEQGVGVDSDVVRSAQLYRQACDGGDMVGCNNLGLSYEHGRGVDEDEVRSAQLYRQACDGGYMRGCAYLGVSYDEGVGVDEDEVRSAQLYRQACDGGDSVGCERLERLRRSRSAPEPDRGPPPAPKPRPGDAEIPEGMVKVAAGPFSMGCNEKVDSECDPDEKPGRTVNLPTFFIDRTEVTVNAYAACVRAGKCSDHHLDGVENPGRLAFRQSTYCNWGKARRGWHPINCVDWKQATEYCAWRGRRLPTESEWEKAARGVDARKYPWGNSGFGSREVANIADETAKRAFSEWTIARGYDDGFEGTSPVGTFPVGVSPYGALDMAGNVWEWTLDWYSRERNYRVSRGGGWLLAPSHTRASNRGKNLPARRNGNQGFRCAYSDSPPSVAYPLESDVTDDVDVPAVEVPDIEGW